MAEQKVGADGLELWRLMIHIFLENYALVQLMKENEFEEVLGLDTAKTYYNSL